MRGKTYIVTGGASGMGRSAVQLLIRREANVVIADINDRMGVECADELRAQGAKVAFVHCDIAVESDVLGLIEKTLDQFGGLHGAFNNAAIPQAGLQLADVSADQFRRTMELNVIGTFLCMKYEILAMLGGVDKFHMCRGGAMRDER